jgi:hypothetical protein
MGEPREHDDLPEDAADDAHTREFRGSFADDPNASDAQWTTLCTLPPARAESLRERLDAAGIPCELHEEASAPGAGSESHAKVEQALSVHVLDEDLEAAQEVASRAAFPDDEDNDPDDEEDPAEREERLLANWICPRCHERKLDLLPRKRWWYHLAFVLAAVFILPIIIELVINVMGDRQTIATYRGEADRFAWPWILTLVGLGCALVLPKRERRCRACGWDTMQSEHSSRAEGR